MSYCLASPTLPWFSLSLLTPIGLPNFSNSSRPVCANPIFLDVRSSTDEWLSRDYTLRENCLSLSQQLAITMTPWLWVGLGAQLPSLCPYKHCEYIRSSALLCLNKMLPLPTPCSEMSGEEMEVKFVCVCVT